MEEHKTHRDIEPYPLEFYRQAFALKDVQRTGWVLRGIREPESVAGHTWGTALLCAVYAHEAGVDRERTLLIAVVHDIAESITGDIATRVDKKAQDVASDQKARAERKAMSELTRDAADDMVEQCWDEYERGESPEAVFVRDMNLIDMCIQALIYEEQRRYSPDDGRTNFPDFERLDEFFATSQPRLQTRTGRRLFRLVKERYDQVITHSAHMPEQ